MTQAEVEERRQDLINQYMLPDTDPPEIPVGEPLPPEDIRFKWAGWANNKIRWIAGVNEPLVTAVDVFFYTHFIDIALHASDVNCALAFYMLRPDIREEIRNFVPDDINAFIEADDPEES